MARSPGTQPVSLTTSQRKHLLALVHNAKPVVRIGQNGVSDALLEELDRALTHHELLKIKVASGDREARQVAVDQVCKKTGALQLRTIGAIAVLYRPHPEKPVIQLPR